MTAPDPAALDDAAIEALLGDVTAIDDATDTPPADWKPPTWAEHKALQDKLSKANNSAKNIRLRLKDATKATPASVPPKPGSPAAGQGGDDKPPVDAAALRAEIEAEYKAKQDAAATQSAAVTALVAAGLKLPAEKRTAAVKRAVRLLDLDGVSADDSAALDAAIDEVKAAWPALFGVADGGDEGKTPVRAHQRRLGGPGAAAGTGTGGKALSAAEQLAQSIFGTSK
jgi:hypothetical protein